MRIVTLFLLLLLPIPVLGGFERTEAGARQAALANAGVGLSDDLWILFFNPGGLASLSGPQAGFSLSPSPFGMRELTQMSGAAAIPTSAGVWGASLRTTGFELYREYAGSLTIARQFAYLDVGLSLRYCSVSITNYGAAGCLCIDAGILLHPAPYLQCALSALGINAPSVGGEDEKLPQQFSAGASWRPAEDLVMLFQFDKELGFEPVWKVGVEYRPIEAVGLRTGVADRPAPVSAGIGISWGVLSFDYAFSNHPELGGIHEITVTIR